MLYSRMTEHSVYRPSYVTDNYNHSRATFTPIEKVPVYVVLEDRTLNNTNDLKTYTATLVGYTQDKRIKAGWKVDNMLVKSVLPHRHFNVLYLEETEDGE